MQRKQNESSPCPGEGLSTKPNSVFDDNSTTSSLQMLLLTHGDNGRRTNMNMTVRRPVNPCRSLYGNSGYGSFQKVPLPSYNYNMDPHPALSLGPFKSVGGRSTSINKTWITVDPLWTPYCLLSGNVRLFASSSNNPLPSYNYRSHSFLNDDHDPLELSLGPYKSMGRKNNKRSGYHPWLNGGVTRGRTCMSARPRVTPRPLGDYDHLELTLGPSKFVGDSIVNPPLNGGVTRGTGYLNIPGSMSCPSYQLAKLLKEKKQNHGG